jgi:hypothetical protein
MCWSLEASAAVATAGFAAAGYSAYRRDSPAVYATLGYFSVMEALQCATYLFIDDCESAGNQLATVLGYLHIAFQPFFINLLALHFVPHRISRLVAPWVYTLCFIGTIGMLLQLYPFEWAGSCAAGRPLCGEPLCALSGEWHIAWQVPTNGIGNGLQGVVGLESGFPSYVIMSFVAPVLYGSWRLALFHYLLGPTLAHQLTDNLNEWPAVWCLLSVGLLLIAVESPLRRALRVRSWFGLGRELLEDDAGRN